MNDTQDGNRVMSLLDYFAGQALNGWASGRNNGGDFNETHESKAEFVATSCHIYADAMLAERNRRMKAQPL